MAKCLLKWSKCSHWDIEPSDSEYCHWFARKYPIGYGIFGWSECQWNDYSTDQKVSKEANKSHEVGGFCDISNICI